ncbi:RUN and FYVE domain-containing protein 1-like [Etheostoma spectabile]|uniref:RUN and FYVE domain-containing protein 1-like n=1 Tax=Etheostoma spectabile TaxID=54343 RepID=UPI0013AF0C68|nr:RUN and FYVE domain-containing protein 1-like [Etheostoma spectabile]
MENGRKTMVLDRLNRRFRDCNLEKVVPEKKLEKLSAHLGRANNRYMSSRAVENFDNQEEGGRQQEKANTQKLRKLNDFWRHAHGIYLQEHQTKLQLRKELEMIKHQLAHEKALKERFIYKAFEADNALRRLQKCLFNIDMAIANEVHNERKQKKVFQKELEELKVAHKISQQRFSAELMVEKDKIKGFQQELKQLEAPYQIDRRDERKLKAEREESDGLQEELENEVPEKMVMKPLRAEGDTLLQQIEEEIQALHKQTLTNQELATKLQAEAEVSQGLRSELTKLKEEQKDETGKLAKETLSMMMDDS